MEVRVQDGAWPTPFLRAKDAFETEFDLELPVKVFVRDHPDERTWTSHHNTHHVLNITATAARSTMGRELAIHEFSHMHRHEQGHPSHHQSTTEAIYLSAAGQRHSRARITQCYQIANHMKDIYADDLTIQVTTADKLVSYLESCLATEIGNSSASAWPSEYCANSDYDPAIVAVNAAFAVGLLERHELLDENHHLFTLARVAAHDAPEVPFEEFRQLFSDLGSDPDRREYRRWLVQAATTYLQQET